MSWSILQGDVRERLRDLDDASVQTCVTSPPYWGLRDYGTDGQLGLEPTPEQYVENMVAVFREVRRVLRDDGTLWLNLGDSYAGSGKGPSNRAEQALDGTSPIQRNGQQFAGGQAPTEWLPVPQGLKPKDLCGIPWRVAFALQADGWWLRSDIIWAKPNPMPESVTDRPTRSHEYLFLLTKSARYFYDADAIRESWADDRNGNAGVRGRYADDAGRGGGGDKALGTAPQVIGRNKRSVWTVTTQPYPDAHFATFPPKLVEPCILAGSRPGDTVLDPFCGAGTTGLVALRHDRSFVGIELNPDYCELARNRIRDDAPLLNAQLEAA